MNETAVLTRKIAALVYQLRRVVETYSDVAIQLEHDADCTKNKAKGRVIAGAARATWDVVYKANATLITAPERVYIPINQQWQSQQYDRYLGGQWLRERAPRVYWRHEKLFRHNHLENGA